MNEQTQPKRPMFDPDAAEEYFANLCVYYREEKERIFKADNEGRHPSNPIWSAECQKLLVMELAIREVLEYFSKFDLGTDTKNRRTP